MDFRQTLPDRDQILAAILQAAGDFVGEILLRQLRADRLEVAPIGRPGERGDLRAGVVDVVFLGDVIAGLGEQIGQRIADDGAATMPDMHRPGGIGGDIFHVHPQVVAGRGIAIGLSAAQNDRQQSAERDRFDAQIDEAGAGDGDPGHFRCLPQEGDQGGGDLLRRLARGLGGDQRGVGGHVAVGLVLGGSDLHAGGDVVRQVWDDLAQSGDDGVTHAGVNVVGHGVRVPRFGSGCLPPDGRGADRKEVIPTGRKMERWNAPLVIAGLDPATHASTVGGGSPGQAQQ